VTRNAIYNANVEKIQAHNAKQLSNSHAVNAFADLTAKEFAAQFASGAVSPNSTSLEDSDTVILEASNDMDLEVTESLDWCDRGACNAIQTQKASDCWAFSAAGATEGCAKVHMNFLPKLSEQFIVDCSGAGSAKSGGWPNKAFTWLAQGHGFCSGDSYRYAGSDGQCKESRCTNAIQSSSFVGIEEQGQRGGVSASTMKQALNKNPVSGFVAHEDMQFHSQGVITSSCQHQIDHAITIVGYGSDGGKEFFKIRNSWGQSWGESGYARLASSSNAGCILKDGYAFPKLSGSGPSPGPPSPGPRPPSPRPPSPGPSGCTDMSGWQNSEYETCGTYESNQYCTSDGGEGSGWNRRQYGPISRWTDRRGNSALVACCACGGGNRRATEIVV